MITDQDIVSLQEILVVGFAHTRSMVSWNVLRCTRPDQNIMVRATIDGNIIFDWHYDTDKWSQGEILEHVCKRFVDNYVGESQLPRAQVKAA